MRNDLLLLVDRQTQREMTRGCARRERERESECNRTTTTSIL